MALRADSYGSVAEVVCFTRYLLDGYTTFNATTRPTVTEVEQFIDRASGALNAAMRGEGLTVPIVNSTAKLTCADWVTAKATEQVELTQRGAGFNDSENSRYIGFRNLAKAAADFAKENRLGFIRLGVGVGYSKADGLQFTGLDAEAQRSDPDDSTLEQPLFTRHQFDDPATTHFENEEDET